MLLFCLSQITGKRYTEMVNWITFFFYERETYLFMLAGIADTYIPFGGKAYKYIYYVAFGFGFSILYHVCVLRDFFKCLMDRS